MSHATEQLIQQAVSEAKAGNKANARKILSQVVRQEPDNTRAWYLLSQIVDEKERAVYCLEKVLRLQPENQQARERLKQLGQPSSQTELGASISPRKTPISKKHKSSLVTQRLTLGVIGLIFIIGIIIVSVMAVGVLLPSTTLAPTLTKLEPTRVETTIAPIDLSVSIIKSINDFENSRFCQIYKCIRAAQMPINGGVDNAYFIGEYPVYNEFFIELTTVNDNVTNYGMTLDPRPITSEDMRFIEVFLTSFNRGEVNPQLLEFIRQNLGNYVSQICYSQSIQFGSMRLWVGMVGLAPTLYVVESCALPVSSSTPTPTPTPLPPGSAFDAKGEFGNWQISIDKVLVAETMHSTVSNDIEKAKGRFVILFMTVINRGFSPDTFLASANFRIQDAKGIMYEENILASFCAWDQYKTDLGASINPDETQHVVSVYDISKESAFYIVVPSLGSELNASVLVQVP